MACDRFTQALTAHAAGAPLSPAAAAHLAVCADCQAVLTSEAELQGIISGALASVGAAAPAPSFAVHTRERVAQAAPTSSRRWVIAAGLATAASLAAAIVFAPSHGTSTVEERPTAKVIARAPPGMSALSPEPVVAERRPVRQQEVTRVRPRAGQRVVAPIVLVPPGQLQSLARLADSLRTADPALVSQLFAVPPAPTYAAATESPAIEPIQVPDVPVAPLVLD